MITLPRNLEHLISEARCFVNQQEPGPGELDQDEVMRGVNEHFEKLSRGEFDQALYWQCQAEDCEEDGEWQEALEAYQKILDETECSDFEAWQAHGWLARLHEMLGEDELSLKHLQAATQNQRADSGGFYALSIVSEAWYYLRIGDWRKAESLLRELQSSSQIIYEYQFYLAKVLTTRAACQIPKGYNRTTKKLLRRALNLLDSQQATFDKEGLQRAAGVLNAYCTFWTVEAERCRLVGDGASELQAWRESLKLARELAANDPLSIVFAEYKVMRRLLEISDACQRHGHVEEATEHLFEAESICLKRRFPESTKRLFSLQPQSRKASFFRFWDYLR